MFYIISETNKYSNYLKHYFYIIFLINNLNDSTNNKKDQNIEDNKYKAIFVLLKLHVT